MPLRITSTAFGAPALDALARVVGELKGDDPLAPVTVVVPSAVAGLHARRALARRSGGLAAVTFLPLVRLAELVGAPRLAEQGLRPVTVPLVAAASSQALRQRGGRWAASAGHPATERALVATLADLRSAPAGARAALRGLDGPPSAVAAIADEVDSLLTGTYDEVALFGAATQAVEAAADLDFVGPVVVWLPRPSLTPPAVAFVAALAQRVPAHALVGLTGEGDADATTLALAARLGTALTGGSGSPPVAAAIISAPDADEEVRAAVQRIVAHLEAGGRLDRTAILYTSEEPYALLLQQTMQAAGLPFAAPSRRRLRDTILARTVLALLALPESDFRRDDVIALLSTAPVLRGDENPVRVAEWDRLSRRAGVVRGIEQWRDRCTRARDDVLDRLAEENRGEAQPSYVRRLEREAESFGELIEFMAELETRLGAEVPTTWTGLVGWVRELVKRYLGGEHRRADWPDDEIEAALQVDRVLDTLAGLDALAGVTATVADLHRALLSELDRPSGRVGRFGVGVALGPLDLATGLDLELVVVVGLAEGTWPHRPGDDPLVPQRVRDTIVGYPARGVSVAEQHRRLLAAIAAGAEVVLSYPRGDLRNGRAKLPSRWLLDTAAALHGGPVRTGDLVDITSEWIDVVPSFAASLGSGRPPAGLTDRDLAELVTLAADGVEPIDTALVAAVPALALGFATIAERRRSGFTRFDGNAAGVFDARFIEERVLSPTSVESYAACPFRYLLSSVLRVGELEKPEETHDISPRDRGSLVHEVLERFVDEVLARPLDEQPGPDDAWTDPDHQRLHEIAADVFDRYQSQGLTGRALLWRRAQRQILADLSYALHVDDRYRRAFRARPSRVELPFGSDGAPPVVVEVGGRTLRFRGRADRVDRTESGGVIVIDYKTGSARDFKALDHGDPVQRGTKLQLPLYGLAARADAALVHGGTVGEAVAGEGTAAVRSVYQFPSSNGGFGEHGYDLDEARLERFREVVGTLADGISAGHFPPRPGPWDSFRNTFSNCVYCDFDRLCPAERDEQWRAASQEPELATFVELAERADEWIPPT